MDYLTVHDGSTYTLLLSENTGNTVVPGTNPVAFNPTWGTRYDSTVGILNTEADFGIVYDYNWEPDQGVSTDLANLNPYPPNINVLKDYGFAHPSSGHPGGVNVFFGDNHGIFLADTLDYLIYQGLMTPDGQQAGTLAGMVGSPANPGTPVLPNLINSILDPGTF